MQIIGKGEVFIFTNWITEEEVQLLRRDIGELMKISENFFAPSGLSNTANSHQSFGEKDRLIHPISSVDLSSSRNLAKVKSKIDNLRRELATVMGRPSLLLDSLDHEFYFSLSKKGATLARHLDEHHEETKGAKGWLLSSRRSISWLLYLCSPDWDTQINGGALRSFPQNRQVVNGPCGADEGNLQVGWLVKPDDKEAHTTVEPVFLDAWRVCKHPHDLMQGSVDGPVPCCALYKKVNSLSSPRQYISVDFDSRDPHTGKIREDYTEFLLSEADKNEGRFLHIEDLNAWKRGELPAGTHAIDTPPTGGSLVLFDSVALPHEVLETLQGERLALAGWFHEEQQAFPSWLSDEEQ